MLRTAALAMRSVRIYGLRVILLEEARELVRRGILVGIFSDFQDDELPKYVWSGGSACQVQTVR